MSSVFEEFEIHSLSEPLFTLAGHPISFTNSALFMFLSIIGCTLFMVLAVKPQAVVPGRWQMMAEKLYNLVADLLESGAGEKAKPFFPFIFTIFSFILFANLFGMLPWSHSVTSHIIVNFSIAILLFIVIIITGFARHGVRFLTLFVPHGVPVFIAPLLAFLEFFSFLVRPFSLSIRLFGNMLAGHLLLQVFAGLTVSMVAAGWVASLGFLPMIMDIAIIAFEFFVAFLQAYIYAVLASVYLRDAIEMH